MLIRLDKYLADMQVGTRSEVKELIRKKRVTVNDNIVTKPESKINTDGDSVNVDSFKFTLQHVIIPPFVSLLQTEFAALYMRHNWDNVKRVNFGGLDYCVEES